MRYLLVILVIVTFVGYSYAEVGDTHPGKVGVAYNIDDGRCFEAIGGTVKADLHFKNLDYDILVVSEIGETFTDDEKVLLNQLSYNYDVTDKLSLFAGLGIGLERFEKFESHRLGEYDKFVSGGVSYKW
jgi:hypothetical protein